MQLTLPYATLSELKALDRIARGAADVPAIRRILAFGSRVRGDFRGDSDLDLLVVVSDISARMEVIRFLSRIEDELEVPLSPVIYSEKEIAANRKLGSAFIHSVQAEGVELYDAERPGKG